MAAEEEIQTQSQTAGAEGSEKRGVKNFRTFETDIAEYAKGRNLSLIDIATEESKFRGSGFVYEDEIPSSGRKILIISAAVFIVFSLAVGGYFAYWKKNHGGKNNGETTQNGKISQPPIITDDEIEIMADKDRKEMFLRDLKTILGGSGESGELFNLTVVKNTGNKERVTTKEFFDLVKANAPAELADYLNREFLFLKWESDEGYPILIFKTSAYDYVFPAMLNWEKAMAWELKNVFISDQNFEVGAFSDKFVQNRDARVLTNADGETKLAYSFLNRKYLIITNNETALAEIFSRFSSTRYLNPAATW